MKLLKFSKCPVCKSPNFKAAKSGYKNMYSEQISQEYKIEEYQLIRLLKNVQCINCGLIYKKQWFNEKTSNIIFNKIVPVHPKGWDIKAKKFNLNYFKKKLVLLRLLVEKNKKLEINKTNRELISIADSLTAKDKNEKKIKNKLIVSIKRKEFKKIVFYVNKIKDCFSSPEEFKRFRGFNSVSLREHTQTIIGKLENLSEIGCPLWGNLNVMSKKNIQCSFIKGRSSQFWGYKCKKNNSICHNQLNKKIVKYNKIPQFKKKIDYLGAYLYLDHVIDPVNFIKKIFKFSNSLGIILERSSTGVPVQHFTGWNINSIKYLANKFNKNIDFSFSPIKKTGKDFYLIY